MRTTALGQGLFAIATASLAIWSLACGDFPWGEHDALARIPSRETWVYGSALIVLLASAGLCFPRTALPGVLTLGTFQALGVAISAPRILADPLSVGAWYPVCEALTALAAAWLLYAMLREQSRRSGNVGGVRSAQVLFGLTCVFYGWSHFVYADYTAILVPVWLPGRLEFAYLTGLGHVAAGLAIIFGILARLAATLEAIMMSLFGLMVWVPTFFARPPPDWATPPEHQWSELVVNLMLAAAAWIVAIYLGNRTWLMRGARRYDR